MKILMVYPETPDTFWGFKNAVKFISKKASEPPLGLITVAAMLPPDWEIKLIDMNVSPLKDNDIKWADYVFLSGMIVQYKSFKEVIKRCNVIGTKIIAGGPLATTEYKGILGVDHFILNEAEITLPQFLTDLENGNPKFIYTTNEYPSINLTPIPRYELLEMKKYATMDIQYSRGCPYDCEFCSITWLNGRKPRVKSTKQFLSELDYLYNLKWRGEIMIVDDNFIGNKRILKNELLPSLIKWNREKKYPFKFITEASINLADDKELSDMMIEAGFSTVFVGIETTNEDSLIECGKKQNTRRSLNESIDKLHDSGFIVSGGFILGFDNDTQNSFEQMINFIQKTGIVTAMVGLLNAPSGTKLFNRLKSEKRILENFTGNNMDGSINFIPIMPYQQLINGYVKVIKTIYAQEQYYNRIKVFLKNYKLPNWHSNKISKTDLKAFLKLIWKLGLNENGKIYFWKLVVVSLFKYPQKFSLAMTLAVYGFHFRKIAALL
ncbi:MAG: DUF4070 domain-containing protein [Ignavibacteriae bacterium]|nr:DUF4070 domain-containing protein [Ignavibacteriota bacterium]